MYAGKMVFAQLIEHLPMHRLPRGLNTPKLREGDAALRVRSANPRGLIFSRELSLSGPWACYTAPTCTYRPQRNGITDGWGGIAQHKFLPACRCKK